MKQFNRSALERNKARSLPRAVTKNADGTYTATVERQPDLTATGPTETEAMRALAKEIDTRFTEGTLKIDQKFY